MVAKKQIVIDGVAYARVEAKQEKKAPAKKPPAKKSTPPKKNPPAKKGVRGK